MDALYKAETAVLNQCQTIHDMRAEGKRRVDAYWERRQQRAWDEIYAKDDEVLASLHDVEPEAFCAFTELAETYDRQEAHRAPVVPSFHPVGWDVLG